MKNIAINFKETVRSKYNLYKDTIVCVIKSIFVQNLGKSGLTCRIFELMYVLGSSDAV